ncbi:MAG: immunoglobulin domain-containing protein [Bacteroidota bacterium]
MKKLLLLTISLCLIAMVYSQNQQWDTQFDVANAPDGKINAVTKIGNNIYVGGEFTTAGGVTVNNVAMWDGTNWNALGTGTDGKVNAIFAWNNTIYVGGDFTTAGGFAASNFASWDGGWTTYGFGTNGEVFSVVKQGDYNIFIGGDFSNVDGVSASNIAKFDGTVWTALSAGTNDIVYALGVLNSSIVAGGAFTQSGSIATNYLSYWNGTDWSDPFGGTNDTVFSILSLVDSIYVGGAFTQSGAIPTNYISKYNGSWEALGIGVNNNVYSIANDENKIYATGKFSQAGGNSANFISVWDNDQWNPLGDGLNNTGKGLTGLNHGIYVGGEFTTAGINPSLFIAHWGSVPEIYSQPSGKNTCLGDSITMEVDILGTDTIYYQWQFEGTNITGATDSILIINPVTAIDEGNYNCIISNQFGSISSDTVYIDIIEPPVFTSDPIGGNFCVSEPLNFTVTADGEDVMLQWQYNGADIPGAINSFYFIPGLNISNSGIYQCIAGNLCGMDTSLVATFIVNSNPVVSFTGLDTIYCNSDINDTLTGTPVGGIFSGDGISGNVFNPLSLTGVHTISYAYVDTNGCTGVYSEQVDVNAGPTLSIYGLENEYCFNDLLDTLSGLPYGGIITGLGISDSIFNPQAVPYGSVNINYSMTDVSGCQLAINVETYINAPTPSVISGLEQNYCPGTPADTFNITPAGGILSGAVTDFIFDPYIAGTGTHNIYYTFTDSNSCINVDTFSVEVAGNLTVNLGNDTSICMGEYISGSSGYDSYFWSNNDTTVQIPVIQSGNYSITVTDTNGCSGSDVIYITILSTPVVNLGNDLSMSTNQTVIIGAGGSYDSYLWSTGATTGFIVVEGNVLGTGYHSFWVTAVETSGCSDSDTIIVHVGYGILVEENEASEQIQMFPVPAEDFVNLIIPTEFLPVSYKITDINGQIILKNISQISEFSINTSYFSKGIYIISLGNDQLQLYKKLIKN